MPDRRPLATTVRRIRERPASRSVRAFVAVVVMLVLTPFGSRIQAPQGTLHAPSAPNICLLIASTSSGAYEVFRFDLDDDRCTGQPVLGVVIITAHRRVFRVAEAGGVPLGTSECLRLEVDWAGVGPVPVTTIMDFIRFHHPEIAMQLERGRRVTVCWRGVWFFVFWLIATTIGVLIPIVRLSRRRLWEIIDPMAANGRCPGCRCRRDRHEIVCWTCGLCGELAAPRLSVERDQSCRTTT